MPAVMRICRWRVESADPLGNPLTGQSEEQQRHGRADRERHRQHDGAAGRFSRWRRPPRSRPEPAPRMGRRAHRAPGRDRNRCAAGRICFCGMRANGRSSICSNLGKIKPRPIATSATNAIQRIASCGRCSSDSSADPTRVTRLKLSTRPPITRYGREASRFDFTATATPPPSGAASASASALCAPEKKITGSTGRMHGEMPVMRPPTRPISAIDNMAIIRHRKPLLDWSQALAPTAIRQPGEPDCLISRRL